MKAHKTLVFAAGDIIIQEGDCADYVYTLVQGQAEAFQHDIKVGEILPGEFFGALAALCNTHRNATVKARTLCRVEAVSNDNFIMLAKTQPELCVKLITDMARLIDDLNESIRILSSSATDPTCLAQATPV